MTLLLKSLFIPGIITIAWMAIGIATHCIAASLKYVKLLSYRIFFYILFGPIGTIVVAIHTLYTSPKESTHQHKEPVETYMYHWSIVTALGSRHYSSRITKPEGYRNYIDTFNDAVIFINTISSSVKYHQENIVIEVDLILVEQIEDELEKEQSLLMLFI